MAITHEERKKDLAYNIGSLLSTYEPKLLESFIRTNEKSEFVKTMKLAKEHNEFSQGIPRKEFTVEFKNGYHNGQSLIRNDPKLLDRLIDSKTLPKDYIRGLESCKAAYNAKKLKEKIQNAPRPIPAKEKPDFNRGVNDGYLLAKNNHGDVINFSVDTQKRWSPYIKGLQSGKDLYFGKLEKEPNREKISSKSPESITLTDQEYTEIREKIDELKGNAENKTNHLESPQKVQEPKSEPDPVKPPSHDFSGFISPGWAKNQASRNEEKTPENEVKKDAERDPPKDIEPER